MRTPNPTTTGSLRTACTAVLFAVLIVTGARLVRADAPPERYAVTAETVLDTKTGLSWQRVLDGGLFTLAEARTYCADLTLAGQTDWRLPAVSELLTLVDTTRTSPALDSKAFTGVGGADWFWTSTPSARMSGHTWRVSAVGTSGRHDESFQSRVRCVR